MPPAPNPARLSAFAAPVRQSRLLPSAAVHDQTQQDCPPLRTNPTVLAATNPLQSTIKPGKVVSLGAPARAILLPPIRRSLIGLIWQVVRLGDPAGRSPCAANAGQCRGQTSLGCRPLRVVTYPLMGR